MTRTAGITAYDVLVHRSLVPVERETPTIREPWPVRTLRRLIARLTASSYARVIERIFVGGDLLDAKGRPIDPATTIVSAALHADGRHELLLSPFKGHEVVIRALRKDEYLVSRPGTGKGMTVAGIGIRDAVSAMASH